jgi:putative copper resistance protein D
VIEAAVIVLRLFQYAAGSILMGSALFVLYALPRENAPLSWAKPLLTASALALTVSALVSYVAQTAMLAGSWQDALGADALGAMLTITLGKAALVRAGAAALAALVLINVPPSRLSWATAAALGAVAVVTFGWMGHGADSETWTQIAADVVHVLAAATWIGALVAFLFVMRAATEPSNITVLHQALRRFSGVGVPLVALLVVSGLINSWFLVGTDNVLRLLTTDYGRLLSIKIALFAGMLALAALNRNRHTPAIERARSAGAAISAVRRSIWLELLLGLAVLAAVAWFGMLEPPTGS